MYIAICMCMEVGLVGGLLFNLGKHLAQWYISTPMEYQFYRYETLTVWSPL